jgi:hypothetical protein
VLAVLNTSFAHLRHISAPCLEDFSGIEALYVVWPIDMSVWMTATFVGQLRVELGNWSNSDTSLKAQIQHETTFERLDLKPVKRAV